MVDLLFSLAWIASKVKTVAPALPAPDSSASESNAPTEISGGSMGIPNEGQSTTKRRKTNRNKVTVAPDVGTNDDGSSKVDDTSKGIRKRRIE